MSNEQENPKLVVDVETLFQQFEELVDRASEGKEIVITRDDVPFAKLLPYKSLEENPSPSA